MFFKRFRKPRPTTDAEFVAAYKATGDLELLGELYERYMDMVYAVCFKYLRDEEESKDAVMQLFEQLIADLHRHEIQNFKSWLHTVARNHCLMQLRSRESALQKVFVNDQDPDDERLQERHLTVVTDDDEPDLEYNLNQMNGCMATLPTEQRTCLDLFYLQQKSYVEVADQTGFSLKQVKSYLQNGRRNLKICMERHSNQ